MVRDRTELLDEDEAEEEKAGSESAEPEQPEVEAEPEPSSESATTAASESEEQNSQSEEPTGASDSSGEPQDADQEDSEPAEKINIREDWDGSTYYIKPEQADKLDDEFRDLKRKMKREEDVIVEKHKHFFRAVIEVSIEDNLDEVLEKARELAEKDNAQPTS